jgi:predicted DCC family thiol-disulfide oxidoreductase YuxK
MAWAVRRDRHHVLVAVPIQSPRGAELLADLAPSDRLRCAHVVHEDGSRRSGGGAGADVLSVLPRTRLLGRLARSSPRATELLYGVVARRRQRLGRLIGKGARRRADDLLAATSAGAAAELELGSRSQS